jgi:hypothetical protein
MGSSFLGFLDHTQWRTTVGRTPLDEWSARCRDLYLTAHNTRNRQTSMPPVELEPTISAGERPQTYALDRAATGTGYMYVYTGCPRRNVPDFGRMFRMLKYTGITQNTYIQSWTITKIMAGEKCGRLAVSLTVPVKLTRCPYTAHVRPWEWNAVNVATAM